MKKVPLAPLPHYVAPDIPAVNKSTKIIIKKVKQSTVVRLGIYPKELITYFHTKACTRIFIETSFISVNTWKQPRCPSGREWITNIQTMEYYSMLKRDGCEAHPEGS